MKNKWSERFIQMAYMVAGWSRDPSTKCGAVIVDLNKRVVSLGFNGFPKGTSDHSSIYQNREEKYRRVIHAEKNAILFAKRDLTDCILFVVPMPPCSQCAAAIIQSGIIEVVTVPPTADHEARWGGDFDTTQDLFREADIRLTYCKLATHS